MDRFPTKILLAADGSEASEQATRAASELASKSGSELHVVHVWHDVPGPYRHGFVKRELRLQGQETLDEQVRKIEEGGRSVAQAHLRGGRTVDEVVALSEELEVGLLVVGSRGLRGMRRILIGSHSEDIVHHAHVPVLVVRCGEDVWPPSRVVAGDDLSEDARQTGEFAASVAKLVGAPMLLVHAGAQPGSTEPRVEEKLEERAGELEDILGERPQTMAVEGNPAEVLIESAGEGRTLVAVGSRGLGLVERLRLGSVPTKVIRASLDAVLVHPHAGGGR
jgi:nucleotide-binding universal stress UspA family protein